MTGAGRGMGREHALTLAARGAAVIVNDLGGGVTGGGGSAEPAEQVVDEIRAAGGRAVADTSSVAEAAGGRRLIELAVAEFGRVDIVVNNAGILADSAFGDMAPDAWQLALDVNLTSAYNVTRPAWPVMTEQGYGRVVCTTSAAGLFGNPGHANYCASKMGLVGLSRALAVEGAPSGIVVNAVAPLALTRMSSRKGEGGRRSSKDKLGSVFESFRPRDVSALVTWLSHEQCTTTGEIFSVAGSRIARVFVGEASGWRQTDAAPEDIAAQWSQIRSTEPFEIPADLGAEMALISKDIG